jgi:type IX secretion system PorP/SprF family membrane protein
MFKKQHVFILLLLTAFPVLLHGQDPSFSQYYANPMYLNPALTGSTYCGRLTLNYRNQWPSIPKGYVTYNAAFDHFLEKINSGYGVMFTGDRQGDGAITSMMISGLYSYKLQATQSLRIDFGAQATFHQSRIDWERFIFGDMIDPNTGIPDPGITAENEGNWNKSVSFVDFSAGLMAGFEDKFYAGVAINHLTEPDNGFNQQSESKLDMKVTLHGGAEFNLSTGRFGGAEENDITLSPNILYQQQGQFHQLNAGLYTNIYPFVTGVWFRHNFENPDALIVLIGFKQPNYQLGYSFDFTLSDVGLSSGGAHEVSLRWEFCIYKEDYKKRRIKAIKSPTF